MAGRTTGAERFSTRFIRQSLLPELANLWHISRVHSSDRFERMRYTTDHFQREHPEYTSTQVYKDLDAWLAWNRLPNPAGDFEHDSALDYAEDAVGLLEMAMGQGRYGPIVKFYDWPEEKYLQLVLHDDGDVSGYVASPGEGTEERVGPEVVLASGGKFDDPNIQDAIHYFLHHGTLEGWGPGSEGMTDREYEAGGVKDVVETVMWGKSNPHSRYDASELAREAEDRFESGLPVDYVYPTSYGVAHVYSGAGADEIDVFLVQGGPGSKRIVDRMSVRRPWVRDKLLAMLRSVLHDGSLSGYQRYMPHETARRNPSEAAAEKYAEFHGRPSHEEIVFEEEIAYHGHLAALGTLVRMKVSCESGVNADIEFEQGRDRKDRPILCTSEDGKQLYIRGGDQSLDLAALEMDGPEWKRDSMLIGEITQIEYETEKGFDNFDLLTYYHKLGEDTKVRPFLVYDSLNQLMSIVGGQYEVKPEGIVN